MRPPSVLLLALLVSGCGRCSRPPSGEVDMGPAPKIPARRVVTLAPSLTDLIVTLHAADRIVGVTRFDDAPEVSAVARVGGYSDPDVEAVLRVQPDLIVCQPSPGNRGAVEALGRSGIPVVVLPLTLLQDVEKSTVRLGQLLGVPDAADREVAHLQAARALARAAAARRPRRPRVAVLFSLDPLIAAGPGSFVHEMLEEAGADDIVQRSTEPYPRVSPETFIKARPDELLLALMPGDPGTGRDIAGVRAPSLALRSPGFMRPGPQVVEALQELTEDLDRLAAKPAR